MYGDPDSPEPKFPYSEDVQNEYDEDQDNAEFLARYPLIEKWDKDWNKWEQEKDAKYEREQNLRICPICRR
jgi:hypothetical protein